MERNPRADQSARVSEGSVQPSRDPTSGSPPRQEERPEPRAIIKVQPWVKLALQQDFRELDLSSDEAEQRAGLLVHRHWMAKQMERSLSPMARSLAAIGYDIAASHYYAQPVSVDVLAVVVEILRGLAYAIVRANPINLGGDPI